MNLDYLWPIGYLVLGVGIPMLFSDRLAKARCEIFSEDQRVCELENKIAELETMIDDLMRED
jgi:hypothetical protein